MDFWLSVVDRAVKQGGSFGCNERIDANEKKGGSEFKVN